MLLIPAIDLKDGKCVRLKQGDMNDSTTFGADPSVVARRWLDAGGRFDAGSFYAEAEALLADRDRLIDEARD